MSAMSRSDCVLARLRKAGLELPADTRIERTWLGRTACERGAWAWFAWSDSEALAVGSSWPSWALLRTTDWAIHQEGPLAFTVEPADDDKPAIRAWMRRRSSSDYDARRRRS